MSIVDNWKSFCKTFLTQVLSDRVEIHHPQLRHAIFANFACFKARKMHTFNDISIFNAWLYQHDTHVINKQQNQKITITMFNIIYGDIENHEMGLITENERRIYSRRLMKTIK